MVRDWIICSIDMLFKEHLRECTIDNLTYYSIPLTSSIQKTILSLYALVRGFKISLLRFLGIHFTPEKKPLFHLKYNTIMKTNDHKCQTIISKKNSKYRFFFDFFPTVF